MITEPEISSAQSEFLQFLDKLPAAAYTCDAEGLITYYNQQALRVWGRAPKLGDPVDRFCGSFKLHSSDGQPISHDQCWMALALRGNREYNGREIIIERPDGQRVTVLAYANPLHDKSAKLIGAVNVLLDITKQKQVEAALRENDRARNEFLAVLSHELRNPLAPIPFAIELLRPVVAHSPESQSALDVIDRQTQQIVRVVDDLLDIARLSVNKLKLDLERIDLTEVVRSVEKANRSVVEAAGQSLILALPEESVFVQGDSARLKQVITNILQNAVKYNSQGGHIWLTLSRQDQDAVIKIRDTGIGISAEMLDRIFEMFTQAKPRLDRSRSGLGIGLSVTKCLVDLHHGKIVARSDGPGNGSEFEVCLSVSAEA